MLRVEGAQEPSSRTCAALHIAFLAGDKDNAADFQARRRGPPPLTGEAKAAALAKAKDDRRAWAEADRAVDRKFREEKERMLTKRPEFSDIVIQRQPHPATAPSGALLAEIQRILGRSERPVVDFQHVPAQPFTIPTRHPYLPGQWQNRSGLTEPRAKYIVRRVTCQEATACEWDLYELRQEAGTVWRRPVDAQLSVRS